MPTGTRVVLDGTEPQTVFFEGPGTNAFADVEFANAAGVTATSSVWINGVPELTAGALEASDVFVTSVLPRIDAGASWNVATTHVAGAVTALPSTLAVPALQVDVGASLDLVEDTVLTTNLTMSGNLNQNGHSLSVGGSTTIEGSWGIHGGTLTIPAAVEIGGAEGALIVGGGLATLGPVRFRAAGSNQRGLVMTNPADEVIIAGPLTVNEQAFYNASTGGSLTAGNLFVRGNITQTGATGSSGRSLSLDGTRLHLAGSTVQVISVQNNGLSLSHFADVVVSNVAGVSFNSPVWITGEMTVEAGCSVTGDELNITSVLPRISGDFGVSRLIVRAPFFTPDLASFSAPRLVTDSASVVSLGADFEMNGALEIAGAFDVAGRNLTVRGPLDVVAGALDLENGVLEVTGPTNVSGADGAIFISGGSANFATYRQFMQGANTLGLVMRNDDDRVYVDGGFTVNEENFYTGSTESSFAAGELHVRGAFTQTGGTGSNLRSFMTSGTVVFLDGDGAQTVSLAGNSTTTSHFGDLVVDNPGGVVFASVVWVDGLLTVTERATASGGDIVITSVLPDIRGAWGISRLSLVGSPFVVNLPALDVPLVQVRSGSTARLVDSFELSGSLSVPGVFQVNGQDLTVGGNVEVDGGTVDCAAGTVAIGADLLVNDNATLFALNGASVTVGRHVSQFMLSDAAGIVMTDPADRLDVAGDFTVQIGNLAGVTTEGRFTAGELRVGGNVTALDGTLNTGRTLVLQGTRLVLDGTTTIKLGANGPALSRFDDVDILDGASVTLDSSVYSTGDWSIAGELTIPNPRVLTTTGAVAISDSGTLALSGSVVAASCTSTGTITGAGSGCPSP